MEWINENSVVVLGGDNFTGLVRDRFDLQKSQVLVLEHKDQVNNVLLSSVPRVLLLDEQKIPDAGAILSSAFSTSPGLRFVPIGLLVDDTDKALRAFKGIACNITFLGKDDEESVLNFVDKALEEAIILKFWGVRGSTPCPNSENIEYGGNTSCVELIVPGRKKQLILDSGTGIRYLGNHLQRYHEKDIEGDIFITHPHWDHIQGFPFFKPFYHKSNRFSISMPEQYRGGAREILAGHLTKTFFPVTLDMLDASINYITRIEEEESFENFSVDYMVANHPTKTAMYRFKIEGYTIIYAPDNELTLNSSPIRFLEKFSEFIEGADVLIHDGQFDLKMYESRVGWGHSAWERAVEIAKKSGVKRLYLTHHDPDSGDRRLREIDEKLKSYKNNPFTDIKLAREGSQIRLPVPHKEKAAD